MHSIIFIAPPAAGKGTQSEMLTKKYHLPHISTGDLLREEVKKEDTCGKYIKEQMELGKLVSDEIIYELITERLKQSDCDHGYILDGFPRNLEQAHAYEKILASIHKPLGKVLYLSIDEDTARKRILGRISCSKCGAVYNDMIIGLSPKSDGICDHCGNELSKRGDDNEETFQKRFHTYLESTKPLLTYYQDLGILTEIDSTQGAQMIFQKIESILGVDDDKN